MKKPVFDLDRRPRTSWDMMVRNNENILEEPKRLYMNSWAKAFGDPVEADEFMRERGAQGPECGLVGCYAGHCCFIAFGGPTSRVKAVGTRGGGIAMQLLTGLSFPCCISCSARGWGSNKTPAQAAALDLSNGFQDQKLMSREDYGTVEYAQAVVAHFTAIMAKHEDFLKSHVIDYDLV